MTSAAASVQTYQELARCYELKEQPQVRDRFLVLAADAAFASGDEQEADRIRVRLLQLNPHHLLRPFASWRQAFATDDVQRYVEGLRKTYPRENARQLLETLQSGTSEKQSPQPAFHPAALERFYTPSSLARDQERARSALDRLSDKSAPPRLVDNHQAVNAEKVPYSSVDLGPPPAVVNKSPFEAASTSRDAESLAVPASENDSSVSWISSALFYMVLGAGLTWAIHTFAWPILGLAR